MALKESKSTRELEEMIMRIIKVHPDWAHVTSVAVTPTPRANASPHLPNWNVQYNRSGPKLHPAELDHLVTDLQNKFDLAG